MKTKIFVFLLALVLGAAIGINEIKKEEARVQLEVERHFNLARNLYVQGQYDSCLLELDQLHKIIPSYENSMELVSFCEQGHELVERQRDIERREMEQKTVEDWSNIKDQLKREPAKTPGFHCRQVSGETEKLESYLNEYCHPDRTVSIIPVGKKAQVCCVRPLSQ